MRVLHVQKVSGIGGSERHLLALLPGLRDRGIEVAMCALVDADGPKFVDALKACDVEVVTCGAGGDGDPRYLARVGRAIHRYEPDLVHTHLIHADLYGQVMARTLGKPAVSTVHSADSFYRRQPYRTVAKAVGHLACRTVAISEHVAGYLRELRTVPEERLRVIHYGVDAQRWSGDARERAQARARLDIRSDDFVVGAASRLIPGKGHEFLLDAFETATRTEPHLLLLLAGDGPLKERLRSRAAGLGPGRARFLGFLPEIHDFMAACDVVVFPTSPDLSEGFGLAALEAHAAGRPVIATRVGSLPEVVIEGTTGLLVEYGDTRQLQEALLALASDTALRHRLGAEGRRRAETMFTLQKMVSRTLEIYEEVVHP